MKNLKQALAELEDIIETKMSDYAIPETKGRLIRIGNYAIRYSKSKGYIVFDVQTNKPITVTFSKLAAVAVAKTIPKDKNFNKIAKYDQIIQKHFNDICFYEHVIKTTDDDYKKEALETRLECSKESIDSAKLVLDNIIMCDLR
jgi:hypothetical protein